MKENKSIEPGLPAPKALAEEILAQAIGLVEALPNLLQDKKDLSNESLQDMLISFSQILLLGFSSSFARLYPDQDLSAYENEVFLELARLTLAEILQREPTPSEKEYFLTFFRSHFELLRRELAYEHDSSEEEEILDLELKRRLEDLLRRFISQEGEIRYGEEESGNPL